MIKDDLFPFQFIKKSAFTGSHNGMDYRIWQDGETLFAAVFPGPYAFDYTSDELKQIQEFPFSEEGYQEAAAWLDEQALSRDWAEAEAEQAGRRRGH